MSFIRPWQTLRSETVFKHRWYHLRRDTVQVPDGPLVDDYFVSVRPEVVVVFPVTPDGQVLLVRQYKHGIGRIVTEFPGGVYDGHGETLAEAARRELREETGYYAPHLRPLTVWHDNPTKDTNSIHAFLAEGVERVGEQQLDDTESIEVLAVPLSSVPDRIVRGEITSAGSVALGLLACRVLEEGR